MVHEIKVKTRWNAELCYHEPNTPDAVAIESIELS